MGIDISGGMFVGAEGGELAVVDEQGYEIEDWADELLGEHDMQSYSPYYDADPSECYYGYEIEPILVKDIDEKWIADIKAKAEKFKSITGAEPYLIGMQNVYQEEILKQVKLITLKEEIVPCFDAQTDIVAYSLDMKYSRDYKLFDQQFITENIAQKIIIPITHFCGPEAGCDVYLAVNHLESEWLRLWLDNRDNVKDEEISCLKRDIVNQKSSTDYWEDLYNGNIEWLSKASLWQRIKWVFTGVKV